MKHVAKWSVTILFTLLVIFFVIPFALRQPQTEKNWEEALSRVSDVTAENSSTTITNVRDWRYRDGKIHTKDWIEEVTIDTDNIVRTWFVLQPFSRWDAIGHTFLTFELSDGSAYSFSIEARKTKGQTYSALKGLFRTYEVSYAWGTERDFIGRRLFFYDFPLYMYKLELDQAESAAVFTALAKATKDVHDTPRFYNTLRANCTNLLAKIINKEHPKSVPFDLSWYLPGYSDTFLMEEGFIATTTSKDATRNVAGLVSHRATLQTYSNDSPQVFSKALRSTLKKGDLK